MSGLRYNPPAGRLDSSMQPSWLNRLLAHLISADEVEFRRIGLCHHRAVEHGLAALRVGWAYMPVEMADALDRIRLPFNVNIPAQVAAVAALNGPQDCVQQMRDLYRERRDVLIRAVAAPARSARAAFERVRGSANAQQFNVQGAAQTANLLGSFGTGLMNAGIDYYRQQNDFNRYLQAQKDQSRRAAQYGLAGQLTGAAINAGAMYASGGASSAKYAS